MKLTESMLRKMIQEESKKSPILVEKESRK
jgi:hypothetical protein